MADSKSDTSDDATLSDNTDVTDIDVVDEVVEATDDLDTSLDAHPDEAALDDMPEEVTQQIENVPTGPTEADLTALVQAKLEEAQSQTDAKLAELEAQLAGADATNMDARISTIETQVEGLSAELGTLTASVQSALTEGGGISEETLAEITSKSAEVEGVKAQLGEITGQVSTLTQRIEDAETAAEERLAAAEADAARAQEQADQMAANTAFQEALETLSVKAGDGGPFATELNALMSLSDKETPTVLSDNATTGVAALSTLRSQFTELSHKAIRASITAEAQEDGGSASKLGAFLKSQVASRSLEPSDGTGTDAVLSRINAALGDGNLEAVLGEADALTDDARGPLAGWLTSVNTRKSVLDALASLGSQNS